MNACLCFASLVAVTLSSVAPGDPSHRADGAADPAVAEFRSEPIDFGYVIAHGRYIPPPYSLELRGEDVLLNGYGITRIPARSRSRGRSGERSRSGNDASGPGDAAAARLERTERWLNNGAALILAEDGTVTIIRSDDALWLMQILNSDASVASKADQIDGAQEGTTGIVDLDVWRDLVARYEPSNELRTRLAEEMTASFGDYAAAMTSGGESLLPGLVLYGLNVGGMALVVLAFGALLSRQPPRECLCHTCERCGDGSSFLVRNIGLVVVLSTFDLACTLIAGTTGEMLELNPLADPLVKSPAALAAFKLSATLTGATILMGLRRHRRAQVASWWLCLVCSLLTFRWVAFHSLFVT